MDTQVRTESQPQKKSKPYSLSDPQLAHDVLSRNCTQTKVLLCICCLNAGTAACPFLGHEQAGVCPAYHFDDRDIKRIEEVVLEFLSKTVFLPPPSTTY